MKIIISLFASLISISYCNSQINNFVDVNLKNAILEQVDNNKNNKIDIEEIEETKKLKLDEKNISNLTGIEVFKNLTSLNLRKNNISDFSQINFLFNLEELVIGDNNKIANLNLSNLKNLKGLYAFRLGLKSIKFGSIVISNLYLQDNDFVAFETKNFHELYTLNMDGCKNLKELDLTNNTQLVQLYLYNTGIEKLDISKNLILKTMYVEKNVVLIKNENQLNLIPLPKIRGN